VSDAFLQKRLPLAALCLVLALSALVRARDLPWGMQGHPSFAHSQHSDETRKVDYTLDMTPTFAGLRPDPWLLVKGTLLPTIGRLAWAVASQPPFERFLAWAFGAPLESVPGRYLFFRSISALASLVLAALVFLLARMLSGSAWAGVLAAFFIATSFGVAFTGVTYKSDMLMATLVAGVLVAAVHYVRAPTRGRALAMGVALGVAGAAKHSAVFASVVPLVACAVASSAGWGRRLLHLGLVAVATLAALITSAPYYVIAHRELVAALEVVARYQSERGAAFEGYGFQPAAVVSHLLSVGLGPLLTALGLAGFAHAAHRAWRHGERAYLPLLTFGVVYFAVLSVSSWLVLRYTVPLYPLLCAFAGILAWRLAAALVRRGTLASRFGLFALAAVATGQLLWFLAFDRMLSEPTPPARAAAWMRENLPEDARVLEIRRRPPVVYGYSPRPPQVLRALQVDELVEQGQRLGAIPCDYVVLTEETFRHYFRLPGRQYAGYRRFFSELFDRRRFRPVARFETQLGILGFEVPRPFLPEDVLLVAPDTYVFERLDR